MKAWWTKRGFSAVNMICKDLRNKLSIEITSCILFIKIDGPPIDQFSPEKYVTLWLRSHQSAENKRNTGDLMINGKSLKKEVGIFCNFIKLIKLLVKLFI